MVKGRVKALAAAFLALTLSSCTFFLGDHPFSNAPRSSGKLNKTPEVFIQRGQAPQVCRVNEEPFHLYYFIHLRWMPFQKLWIEIEPNNEVELFGKDFTIKVKTRAVQGKMITIETKFRTEKQSYSVSTLVVDCKGVASSVSAGKSLETWGTANESASVAAF